MSNAGVLLLNKPVGVRSTRCVERVRKALCDATAKVGHGGTLDSTASGLLVLLIGGATRLSGLIVQMPKVYRATFKLGCETTTCDYSGEPLSEKSWEDVCESSIDMVIPSFLGWRMQTPPQVSAVHVGGRRAHEIYRAGGRAKIEPRAVFVEAIERLTGLSPEGEVSFLIRCGKGTYVRSLARDMGKLLGCGAHLRALCREKVGPFSLKDALRPGEELDFSSRELVSAIRPLDVMELFLPAYRAPETDMKRLSNGLGVPLSVGERTTCGSASPSGVLMFRSESLMSIGRLERLGDGGYVLPEINIATEVVK